MELPPNDLNNNPFLRKELERGKSKADARFEDGPDNKRARTLQSVASLQVLARRALPALAEVPEMITYGVDRAYPGRPPPITIPEPVNYFGNHIIYTDVGPGFGHESVSKYSPNLGATFMHNGNPLLLAYQYPQRYATWPKWF